MMGLARHVTVLMKVGIVMACLGMIVLWPEWRVSLQTGSYECQTSQDCGCGEGCVFLNTEGSISSSCDPAGACTSARLTPSAG